jgi:HK97 family phage major capsid protein
MKAALETRNDPIDDAKLDDATLAVNELRTAHDAFRTDLNTRLANDNRVLVDRLTALETRLNRPAIIQTPGVSAGPSLHTRAFDAFARFGEHRLSLEERTAMTSGEGDGGGGPNSGYLVPPEFLAQLDRNLVLFSPMRRLARVMQASTAAVILPKRTANLTSSWEGETDPEPATNPIYGSQTLSIWEAKCYVDVSNRLLEDSAFDINAELSFDFGEEFGRQEGAAFVAGTGDTYKQPLGLINSTITTMTTATAGLVTADELIAFFHTLPSPYAANGTWVMNRATMGMIRTLKNSEGEYIWQGPLGPLSDGNPNLLLGRPVVEFPDMPSASAGNICIAFGDFKSGFRIFDRISLSVLRDPYSQQTAGNVRFHARRRVGGTVTKAEAIRLLQLHT